MSRFFFPIYTCLTPRSILARVDAIMNGEDITMNAVASALTRASVHRYGTMH